MIDVILVDARRSHVAAAQMGLALATGSQILLGCPQYVWFSLLAEIAYVVLLLRIRYYAPRSGCEMVLNCHECVGCSHNPLPRVILAKGLGLLVGAVQLLPTLDALLQSMQPRSAGCLPAAGESTAVSLDPINLVQLVRRTCRPSGYSAARRNWACTSAPYRCCWPSARWPGIAS